MENFRHAQNSKISPFAKQRCSQQQKDRPVWRQLAVLDRPAIFLATLSTVLSQSKCYNKTIVFIYLKLLILKSVFDCKKNYKILDLMKKLKVKN